MPDEHFHNLVSRVHSLPPAMLDARLLAEYTRTGEAYDLSELCRKSGVSLRQVALLIIAGGLDDVGNLPGYAVTREIFDIAENIYSVGETRRQWQRIRNQHKPAVLESQKSRDELQRLCADPVAMRKHFARIFFKSWAVFWDDGFLCRMIGKLDGRLLASIPEELLSERVCFAAVTKTGTALRLVPERLRVLVICARAVKSDSAAIAFTPSRFRSEIQMLIDADS